MLSGMNYNETFFRGIRSRLGAAAAQRQCCPLSPMAFPATVPQMAHDRGDFSGLGLRSLNLDDRHPHRAQGNSFLDRRCWSLLCDEAQDLGAGSLRRGWPGAVVGIHRGVAGSTKIGRGLADVEWRRIESPFGRTSDEFCFGTLDGQAVVFVPRPPGPRPCAATVRDQFSRQCRCV